MTPTKLCPCRQAAADMREAAAHAVFVLGKGERTVAAMRNLKLQPCTYSPGIVAAARVEATTAIGEALSAFNGAVEAEAESAASCEECGLAMLVTQGQVLAVDDEITCRGCETVHQVEEDREGGEMYLRMIERACPRCKRVGVHTCKPKGRHDERLCIRCGTRGTHHCLWKPVNPQGDSHD